MSAQQSLSSDMISEIVDRLEAKLNNDNRMETIFLPRELVEKIVLEIEGDNKRMSLVGLNDKLKRLEMEYMKIMKTKIYHRESIEIMCKYLRSLARELKVEIPNYIYEIEGVRHIVKNRDMFRIKYKSMREVITFELGDFNFNILIEYENYPCSNILEQNHLSCYSIFNHSSGVSKLAPFVREVHFFKIINSRYIKDKGKFFKIYELMNILEPLKIKK